MQVLNSVVTSEQQFYIPRVITVRNEKETGPARGIPAPPSPTPPPTGEPNAQPVPPAPIPPGPSVPAGDPYIVGQEKAEVTMRIDLVDFAETTTAAK
jgi:hypothetical protein